MSSLGAVAPHAALTATSARAQAARINGAKSRGPRTPEGKARSAQNALKHGLRAQKHVVLPEEDAAAYEAHESALLAELAPEGALQALLARHVVAAAWRLERAERIEAELFARQRHPERADLGLALIRDGNTSRTFPTLLRYRGSAEASLWRALRALKALQAEAATRATGRTRAPAAPARVAAAAGPQRAIPNEPERRHNPGGSCPMPRADEPCTPTFAPRPAGAPPPARLERHLSPVAAAPGGRSSPGCKPIRRAPGNIAGGAPAPATEAGAGREP